MVGGACRRLGGAGAPGLAGNGGVLLFGALTLVNGSNFLFHAVVSRQLEPGTYGALGALSTLLLVLAVPAGALQVVITHHVARRHGLATPGAERVVVVVGPLLAAAVIWGVVGAGALVLAAPLLRAFLHLPTLASAVMVAAYVVPAAVGLVPKAVLLGESRFLRVAVGLLAGAVARLVTGIALVGAGAGLDGAMAATVLGEIVTAGILLPGLRPSLRERTEGAGHDEPLLRLRFREVGAAVSAFTGLWLFTGVDTILARHHLPGSESGYYAAAAMGARAALFLPAAVSIVALPRFSGPDPLGTQGRAALKSSLLVAGLLGLGSASVVLLAPDLVVGVLFGSAFEGSAAVVGLLAASAAAIGLITVLLHFHIATNRSVAASLCWAGVGVAAAGVSLAHGSIESIAWVMFATTVLVLLAMAGLAMPSTRRGEDPSATDDGELWARDEADIDVSVVVPYYNPGPHLRRNVERIVETLRSSKATFEVITVSDGSTDGSDKTLAGLPRGIVRAVVLPRNGGKGQALRVGLAMGRGRYVGFIDGDGDLDPAQLHPALTLMSLYEPDVLLGSKRHPLSEVSYPPIRRLYSWGYQQLIRVLFHLNVRDTQTGFKLVRRDVLAAVLPRMVEKRFAFDLELFVVARHAGFRRFLEAPVRIQHQFTSTISLHSVRGMLRDTLAIFYRLHLLRFYDVRGAPRDALVPDRAVGLPFLSLGGNL